MPKSIPGISQEEVSQWLFDTLMEQIEPDLTSKNRSQTVEKLQQLSPEQAKQQLESYKQSYQEFVKRWPKFIAAEQKKMQAATSQLKADIASGDKNAMSNLEAQISHLDD